MNNNNMRLLSLSLHTIVALAASPFEQVPPRLSTRPYTAALVVPTGIGAAIGGYAGDALPVARAFTAVCDRLITHPNVMNGGSR